MVHKIILIGDISDFDVIPQQILQDKNVKKFSFDLDIHEKLESKNIEHELADNLLDQEKRFQILDKMIEFRDWYLKIVCDDHKIEGVNLLKLLDSHEFGTFLMPKLLNLIIIKQIIEKENPKKIVVTNTLSEVVKLIVKDSIEIEILQNDSKKSLLWDKITVKYNFGRIPITFNISRKTYLQIKNISETVMGFFYNFWYKTDNSKKDSIVLLEFNPQLFSKLFECIKNYDYELILANFRRSAVWSKNSLDVVRNSNSKILKTDKILNKKEKKEISFLVEEHSTKINKLFEKSEFFDEFFRIEGLSFWNLVKNMLQKTYYERLPFYISMIYSIKKVFQNSNVKCIISLNEVGETEKSFIEFNDKKIPTILLEHGFIERIEKTKRYDVLSDYNSFKDKIAVWGDIKKNYLFEEYNINKENILVTGSPRHDDYFLSRVEKRKKKEIILLLAPNPISDVNGLSCTELKIRFKKTITEIFSIVKNLDNVKIIVKLHPSQSKHNEEIKSLIQELDNTVSIFLWTPVIETINQADIVMVISPEINGTSTMLLESMILGKPTMNVYFEKNVPEFIHVKDNAVFTVLDSECLEEPLKKILFEKNFQNKLIKNSDEFLKKFMTNRGTASEKFASILKTF